MVGAERDPGERVGCGIERVCDPFCCVLAAGQYQGLSSSRVCCVCSRCLVPGIVCLGILVLWEACVVDGWMDD